ncbi:hypothetical protein [Bacillus kwashiorkori]|uniref:hypothetical protein n=1 Tax=Bacillus kwashiorkori TaxID=1522318 RepID=UPI0007852C9E|nr:hypothetical protein [Bacillus kwashiorkori]
MKSQSRHFLIDEWRQYRNGEVEEKKAEKMEEHLYNCDQCLNLYIEATDTILDIAIQDEMAFTNGVMEQINSLVSIEQDREKTRKSRKKNYYRQKWLHYCVAASATLFLMSSGIFDKVASEMISVQEESFQESKSFTVEIMNKTTGFIDFIMSDEREGGK